MSLAEERKVADMTDAERLAEAEALAAEALRMAEEAKKAAERLAQVKASLSTDLSMTHSVLSSARPPVVSSSPGEEKVDIADATEQQVKPSSSKLGRTSPPIPEVEPREQNKSAVSQANKQLTQDPPAENVVHAESTIAATKSDSEKAETTVPGQPVTGNDESHPFDERQIRQTATEEVLERLGGVNSPTNCCDDEPRLPESFSFSPRVNDRKAEEDAQIAANTCECIIL